MDVSGFAAGYRHIIIIPLRRNRVSRLLLLMPLAFIFYVELEILSLGSARLEVRRVKGDIRNDQVYWEESNGICVFDPNGIKVVDDEARGKPPHIIFEFKFREDPEITRMTQSMLEEDIKSGIVRVTRSKGGTLGLPAIGRAEGVFSSGGSLLEESSLIEVPPVK